MSKHPTIENITQYIVEINRMYKAGNATEHTYRPALKSLFGTRRSLWYSLL